MPLENFEEEGLESIPSLELACNVFQLENKRFRNVEITEKDVVDTILEDNMAPYLKYLIERNILVGKYDEAIASMAEKNAVHIESLQTKLKDTEENRTEAEVRDTMLELAHYYSKIGDKVAAIEQFNQFSKKTLMLGFKIDMIFHQIRIGFFFDDKKLIQNNISKANDLIEEGGDWDRRNRLKVYRGLAHITVRKFAEASTLFLEAVATFTSYELMSYHDFIIYTVLVSLLSLDRPDLIRKMIRGSDIQEVMSNYPVVNQLLLSFYECNYADFLVYLASAEQFLYADRYFHAHAKYYVREMRVKAYEQLLESYSSLSLESMANSFGVSTDFIDSELSRFIASGRLLCRIDKVNGVVRTIRPDYVNQQYQSTIRQGDIILNRVQKLTQLEKQLFNMKFCAKDLERQAKKCEKEEKNERFKLKSSIQKSDIENAKIHAENAIRQKNQSLNFRRISARVDAVASRVQTAVTMRQVTKSMDGVVKSMETAMKSMDLEKISRLMEKFESSFENLDVQAQVMENSMQSTTTLTTPQSQVEGLMHEVADEAGIELNIDLPEGRTDTLESQSTVNKEQDELTTRLAKLRQT